MPLETTPRGKSSSHPDHAGLRSSIVKALFKDVSPSKSPPLNFKIVDNVLNVETKKISPSKKSADLSLSEGDLTLTDELRTPVAKINSQNLFLSNAVSEKNLATIFPATKEKSTKVLRKSRDVNESSASNSESRGPTSEHLAWLKACRKGDLATCEKLLDDNHNLLNYVPPLHLNFSCVHIATLGKHYDLLRLFKKEGANFNATTRSGYTPLHLAAQNQDRETIKFLIEECGVDTKIRDLLGYTYEYYADWLWYPEFDDTSYPLIYCDSISSRCSSRQPSIGSQESLASSKNSFSRNGSLRDTIKELLHIPTKGLHSRCSSLNQL